MSKEEILEYVTKHFGLPKGSFEYGDDVEFCMQLLEIEPYIIERLPDETKKKILLIDSSYLEELQNLKIFEDDEFAKAVLDKNPDVLLEFRNSSIKSKYIGDLMRAYIMGEKVPPEGSKIAELTAGKLYAFAPMEIKWDEDFARAAVEKDIDCFSCVIIDGIRCDHKYILEFVKRNPSYFEKYSEEISSEITPEIVEGALRHDFQNYKLIDPSHPGMEKFYQGLERIRKIRPELSLDNKNLRYDLLCDPEFVDMDINIINSLLEYNTGNVDRVIEIRNSGKLPYLIKFIDQYRGLYGDNLESIQRAIFAFGNVEELLIDTNNFEAVNVDDSKLKTIIATGNKFGINSAEDLLHYDEKVREYYEKKIRKASTIEEVREIYAEMLFNSSVEGLEKFNEEYCNFNIEELVEYAKEKGLESPISEEFSKRLKLYHELDGIEDVQELKNAFEHMPLEICDIEESKTKIAGMYSKGYNKEMLDLSDETLEHGEYEGVDVIRLNGQKFNLFVHRIFNFDFNMNNLTNAILDNPEQWSLTEGTSTISTILITDKKMAALFRPLQESEETLLIHFSNDAEAEKYTRKVLEEKRQIYDGERLKEIDENAVFYGFTDVLENGIIKMDSTDMMVEHGEGHLDIKSNRCRMRASEDLAYWTAPDYWNETAQKRKETDIDRARELREKNGTDRVMPKCIVCFDGKINEQSLLAARVHKIPILMIDRQQYLDVNKQKLEEARAEFGRTLSTESISEIFYRQPYDRVVEEMPRLMEAIRNNKDVPDVDKQVSREYLAYLGQHFIEQSSGYILDVSVEEYNEKMQQYIQELDREAHGKDLVTMEDMQMAYEEVSACDRKKRYEMLKNDMRKSRAKEGEIAHE